MNREIELLAPLTFAIVGYTTDNVIVSPLGTGFFIAPYVGVTAKHVVEGLWRQLAMPSRQDKYPSKPKPNSDFRVRLFHLLDPRDEASLAAWDVTGTTRSGYTDIAFLHIVPANDVAEHNQWPRGFCELQMVCPDLGEKISAVGYPGMRARYTPGRAGFHVDANLVVEDGVVVENHESGRGAWRFPQFETTARFPHGMSGAPVVSRGRICGVVSYASSDDQESYAAALWPLLLQETARGIDPRQNNLPLLDLLRNGVVKSTGWREVEKLACLGRDENDRSVPMLRRVIAG